MPLEPVATPDSDWYDYVVIELRLAPEDVSERVNATVKTIEQHYDKADPEERRRRLRDRMEQRRRPLVDQLDFDQ